MTNQLSELETRLNDFNPEVRTRALRGLLAYSEKNLGVLRPEGESSNLHCHSFYSFNSYGFSPSALVWLEKRLGARVAGLVDFDTLDGVEEFLGACDMAALRGSAAMETRIYIPEFADTVTNSPGEPGISYHLGTGFTSGKVGAKAAKTMENMRRRADQRNRGMVERLNAYLDPVKVDYDQDVLPLTPAGNATERHMLFAYAAAAERSVPDLPEYWSGTLRVGRPEIAALLPDRTEFFKVVRGKLMKRGGVGYVMPSPETFPSAEEFHEMVISCGALPTVSYLDGTTPGEERMEELLELLTGKGVAAMNMVPNLSIPDLQDNPDNSALRRQRCQLLYRTVALCQEFDLVLNVGTEMNSYNQRQIDDFNHPDLAPMRQVFIDGAFFFHGHVMLQRVLGLGYQSEWARSYFPARAERNAFYTRAGYKIPAGFAGLNLLKQFASNMEPGDILAKLQRGA